MNGEQGGAEWFYDTVVEPTVSEFLKKPDDIRHGILAALVVSHMAEHYYNARQPITGISSVQGFRQALRDENGAFRLVSDVADAIKHVTRSKHRGKDRLGFEDVEATPIDMSNLRAGWPIGGTQVIVEDGNTEWLLSHLVKAAIEMWQKKLERS